MHSIMSIPYTYQQALYHIIVQPWQFLQNVELSNSIHEFFLGRIEVVEPNENYLRCLNHCQVKTRWNLVQSQKVFAKKFFDDVIHIPKVHRDLQKSRDVLLTLIKHSKDPNWCGATLIYFVRKCASYILLLVFSISNHNY